MEITKKGIQIIMITVLASTIQEPIFILFSIVIVAVILIAKGGEVRKF